MDEGGSLQNSIPVAKCINYKFHFYVQRREDRVKLCSQSNQMYCFSSNNSNNFPSRVSNAKILMPIFAYIVSLKILPAKKYEYNTPSHISHSTAHHPLKSSLLREMLLHFSSSRTTPALQTSNLQRSTLHPTSYPIRSSRCQSATV